MRVVVDTNVFVGACIGLGASSGVIRACLLHQVTPLIGITLYSEYEGILSRDALFAKSRLDLAERSKLLDIFLSVCQWTRVYFLWRPNVRDESDNHLIELAVAGDAEAIITRNLRDFKSTELRFPQLRVLSPEAFLKEL
jgi:putative PIN family toxin of toxin-antitoxin system